MFKVDGGDGTVEKTSPEDQGLQQQFKSFAKYCKIPAPSWCLLFELLRGIDVWQGMWELILVQRPRYAEQGRDSSWHGSDLVTGHSITITRGYDKQLTLNKTFFRLKSLQPTFKRLQLLPFRRRPHKYLREQFGFKMRTCDCHDNCQSLALFGSRTFQLWSFFRFFARIIELLVTNTCV